MPAHSSQSNLSVGQFAERYRRDMIPLSKPFSYYSTDLPLSEEDIKEYLEEPIAALPPSISAKLPKVSILLVPYLERPHGRERGSNRSADLVSLERPSKERASWTSCVLSKEEALLAFALKDQEVADYHYRFYHLIAGLMSDQWSEEARREFATLLRDELTAKVHGEVDEESWHLKQGLLRRTQAVRGDSKLFGDYARQSLIDTLTLYLHGLCCDIDVETGPRQLPSRSLRKRLMLLQNHFAPPAGYAIFPEEHSKRT